MKKPFIKIVAAVLSFVLIISTVGPVYANAAESKVNVPKVDLPKKSQPNVRTVTETEVNNIETQPMGIKTQVVKAALKYGGTALGKLLKKIPYNWAKKAGVSIEKWGYKAANVVDEITNFGEASVTLALVNAGIPPSDAALIAKFIVFFLG